MPQVDPANKKGEKLSGMEKSQMEKSGMKGLQEASAMNVPISLEF